MPRESRQNIDYVCPDHAPRPDPRWASVDPHTLVGRYVKRAFPDRTTGAAEHMWCEVLDVLPDGTLTTRLDNDHDYDVGYVCGNLVPVRLDEIEAVYEDVTCPACKRALAALRAGATP